MGTSRTFNSDRTTESWARYRVRSNIQDPIESDVISSKSDSDREDIGVSGNGLEWEMGGGQKSLGREEEEEEGAAREGHEEMNGTLFCWMGWDG